MALINLLDPDSDEEGHATLVDSAVRRALSGSARPFGRVGTFGV